MTVPVLNSNKTRIKKPSEVKRKWWLIDAKDLVLGRLAVIATNKLRGKDRPDFTPNIDTGDYVVIINAKQVALTGNKLSDKIYYWHTGYPGGIKERTAGAMLSGKTPELVIRKAVKGMLQKNIIANAHLKRLLIYTDSTHPHEAQKPELIDITAFNKKNKKV